MCPNEESTPGPGTDDDSDTLEDERLGLCDIGCEYFQTAKKV